MKSHFLDRIYLASPLIVQNILVSIMGVIENKRRYGSSYEATSKALFQNEYKPINEIREIENKLLTNILQGALSDVPHYKALGITDPKIDNFPVLDRDTVFNAPESLLSNKFDINSLIKLYTGGSTGNPLTIYLNKDIRSKTYAFWNRFYRTFNFKIGERKASLVGRKLQEPNNDKPPFWRYNLIDKQLLFSSFHLSQKNIPLYLKKLNKFKPQVIEGYPLSILRLADYIIENNYPLTFTPKGISTSSENFTLSQRKSIETAFKCNVYDQYGSAESVIFAGDCEHKNKHISIEYGYIEVMAPDGSISKEGEGELIVTTLINDAMPLIRYRIGDLGKISYKKCPCKRNTPILDELYGKVGSFIQVGDKKVSTAAISIAFEYLKNVKKTQIIQNEKNRVLVKLVVTEKFNKEEEEFMIWELKKMLGNELSIDIELVDNIPPSKNGKYQMLVQNYY